MGAIAVLEVFDRRDLRHWAFAVVLAGVLATSSLIWMSVRGQLRQEIDDELISNSRIERFDRGGVGIKPRRLAQRGRGVGESSGEIKAGIIGDDARGKIGRGTGGENEAGRGQQD